MNQPDTNRDLHREKNLLTVAYALQAASLALGFTYVLAAIIGHLMRASVAGTWLDSHRRWQLRTFWFSLLWGVLGAATALWGIGYFILIADLMWIIYRIVQGWAALGRNQPIDSQPAPSQ
jgi:uncharacterized membrane protein